VPTEDLLSYRGDGGYQDPNPGDRPDVMNWGLPHTQRQIDDFNLAAVPGPYIFNPPTVETATIMPQAAIEGAHYRVTSAYQMGANQLHDLNVWRRILASHREIIMEFRCCDGVPGGNSTEWTLPPGSNGGSAGHVVLVIGYNEDKQMFRIKNSWGPNWADHGYAWMSYQFVAGQPVYNAAWIDAVVAVPQPAQADVWREKQLWLGRWNIDFDGSKGLLDIDNLPFADETARLGTLFLDDGRIFRINGTQNGNLLNASVDWNRWDLPLTELGPTRFLLYLFSWDHTSFAGFQNEGGTPIPSRASNSARSPAAPPRDHSIRGAGSGSGTPPSMADAAC
jgi:Papain family cysteine protease